MIIGGLIQPLALLSAVSRKPPRTGLRQADQARTDFALIESDLEVIQKQLSGLPMPRELAGTALGIIFATIMVTTLSLLFFLR